MRSACAAIADRARGAGEIEELADAQLDAQIVVDGSRRRRRRREEHVGVHEREVADEDGRALAEAASLAVRVRVGVVVDEPLMHRRAAAAGGGAVHHVVVHERARVHHLDRRAHVDDDVVEGIAARSDERPEAERGPEPLPAAAHQVAQRDERLLEVGVDRAPAVDLVIEQGEDAPLRAHARVGEHREEATRVRAIAADARSERARTGYPGS